MNTSSIVIDTARNMIDDITKKDVIMRFKSGDDISVSLIQRKCSCGYYTATRVFEKMVKEGLIKRGKNPMGIEMSLSKFI